MIYFFDGDSGAAPGIDPPWANVVLSAIWGGTNASTTQTDLSTYAHALTFNGNAKISNARTLYGNNSLETDGTGDYVTTPDAAEFSLLTNEFVIDTNYEFASTAGHHTFIGQWGAVATTANRSWVFWYSSGVGLRLSTNASGTSQNIAWTPSTGINYHMRFMRKVDTVYFYANGILIGTIALGPAASIANSTSPLAIGADSAGLTGSFGWFQNTRMAVGWSMASTGNFTPPSAVYPTS